MGSVFGHIGEETPKFDPVETSKDGGYEIRRYHATRAIEARTSEENRSFMTLAGYIGVRGEPRNVKKEPIAMTAPVVSCSDAPDSVGRMQFVLPSQFSPGGPATPPASSNPQVSVVERPPKLMAVMGFSGRWSDEDFKGKRDELVQLLKDDGRPLREPLYWEIYRYNPPWTLNFMRTNEVAVELREGSSL